MRMATAESFDGGFNFCRIMFSESHDGDGGSWGVDYPRADVNLSIRLSELTRTRISRDAPRASPITSCSGSPTICCSSARSS